MNEMIIHFKLIHSKEYEINGDTMLHSILFADDWGLLLNSQYDLQSHCYKTV